MTAEQNKTFIINRTTNAQLEYAEGNALHINEEEANSLGAPALVIDHLILGSSFDVKNKEYMDEMKVGWILNVADECDNLYQHPDIKYIKISLADMVETHQHDLFEQAFRFIEEARQAHERSQSDPNFTGRTRCILHCMRGRSRSATIAIAYLMQHQKRTLRDAYLHVKNLRHAIGPHRHLKRQLLKFETHYCNVTPSITLEEWLQIQAGFNQKQNKLFY